MFECCAFGAGEGGGRERSRQSRGRGSGGSGEMGEVGEVSCSPSLRQPNRGVGRDGLVGGVGPWVEYLQTQQVRVSQETVVIV